MTRDLFAAADAHEAAVCEFAPGAWLLRGLALPIAAALASAVQAVAAAAPFRHMVTPGGFRMSVAMTTATCSSKPWRCSRRPP